MLLFLSFGWQLAVAEEVTSASPSDQIPPKCSMKIVFIFEFNFIGLIVISPICAFRELLDIDGSKFHITVHLLSIPVYPLQGCGGLVSHLQAGYILDRSPVHCWVNSSLFPKIPIFPDSAWNLVLNMFHLPVVELCRPTSICWNFLGTIRS